MDIKTVKGRDYLQIVDNRGYIHHVGPASLFNFAVCQSILGLDEALRDMERHGRFVNYFISRGHSHARAEELASEVDDHYRSGKSGVRPRTNSCGEAEDIENKEKEFWDRIEIFGMLEELAIEEARKKNIIISKDELRRKIQRTYRNASPEQKALLKKELVRKRELEDKRIMQRIQERVKARGRAK